MSRFRRKPTEIEAWQYDGATAFEGSGICECEDQPPHVHTAHGQIVILTPGDWIAPEPDGRGHYPIKPDIFASSYEPIGEPS